MMKTTKPQKNNDTELITDKTAVALSYGEEDPAPVVVASGKGYVAEKIIATAIEEKVPIHQDKGLAKSLAQIEIGEAIPEELYQVVAEVLVTVDKADEKLKMRKAPKHE